MTESTGFTREYYDRDYIWTENYWNAEQWDRAEKTASLLPRDVNSVLEVGCGAGIVTLALQKRFPIVVGLDFAFHPLQQLTKRGLRGIQGDLRFLPFAEKAFDAVVAAEVIEHLSERDRKQALEEMKHIAKKYMLITVPYLETLEASHVKCAECGCVFHAYRHTKSFREKDMIALLNPNFRLVRIEMMGHPCKRVPRFLVMLAHIFGGYCDINRGIPICPQCGNSEQFISRRNLMTRLLRGVPYRLLPIPKYPNWMAALYQRSN